MSDEIVRNLKKIMNEKGMKQKFLREKIGITASAMSSLYRGQSIPTMLVALKIAKVLEKNVEDIWFLEEK